MYHGFFFLHAVHLGPDFLMQPFSPLSLSYSGPLHSLPLCFISPACMVKGQEDAARSCVHPESQHQAMTLQDPTRTGQSVLEGPVTGNICCWFLFWGWWFRGYAGEVAGCKGEAPGKHRPPPLTVLLLTEPVELLFTAPSPRVQQILRL